jgi:hypothetical protein
MASEHLEVMEQLGFARFSVVGHDRGDEFPFAGTQVWSLGMVRARKWRVGGEDIHGLAV